MEIGLTRTTFSDTKPLVFMKSTLYYFILNNIYMKCISDN